MLLDISNRGYPLADALRVAVVGVGSFGRNHARVYRELQAESAKNHEPIEVVGVVDANAAHLESAAREFGVPTFSSVGDLIAQAKPQAVSVAVPTVAHMEVAQE